MRTFQRPIVLIDDNPLHVDFNVHWKAHGCIADRTCTATATIKSSSRSSKFYEPHSARSCSLLQRDHSLLVVER